MKEFMLFMFLFFFPVVLAEITFFEGDSMEYFIEPNNEVESSCGDLTCSSDEDCSSCSIDCGKCFGGKGIFVENDSFKNESVDVNNMVDIVLSNDSVLEIKEKDFDKFYIAGFVFLVFLIGSLYLFRKKKIKKMKKKARRIVGNE